MSMRWGVLMLAMLGASAGAADAPWPKPAAPAVAQADGYVAIPDAALPPSAKQVYKAIFDGTQAADDPKHLLPVLNMAGSELNALAVAGAPPDNAKFVVVFHGAAVNGLLRDDAYKAKFGVANPNLAVLARLRSLGAKLFVCGQHLAFEGPPAAQLSPDVSVASDALLVLMTYQNQGYALLSF